MIHIADLSVICVVPTDGGLRPLQKNDKLVLVDINSVLTVQTCEGVTGYAAEACGSFWSNNTFNHFSTSLCWD